MAILFQCVSPHKQVIQRFSGKLNMDTSTDTPLSHAHMHAVLSMFFELPKQHKHLRVSDRDTGSHSDGSGDDMTAVDEQDDLEAPLPMTLSEKLAVDVMHRCCSLLAYPVVTIQHTILHTMGGIFVRLSKQHLLPVIHTSWPAIMARLKEAGGWQQRRRTPRLQRYEHGYITGDPLSPGSASGSDGAASRNAAEHATSQDGDGSTPKDATVVSASPQKRRTYDANSLVSLSDASRKAVPSLLLSEASSSSSSSSSSLSSSSTGTTGSASCPPPLLMAPLADVIGAASALSGDFMVRLHTYIHTYIHIKIDASVACL